MRRLILSWLARPARLAALAVVSIFAAEAPRAAADPVSAAVGVTGPTGLLNAWAIVNDASSNGEITSVTIDVSTASNPGKFSTTGGFSAPFTPAFGSGATTGLLSPATVANGSTAFTMTFNDFNPGETLFFGIDVDGQNPTSGFGSAVARELQNATEMLGTTVSITWARNGFEVTETTTLGQLLNLPILGGVVAYAPVQADLPTPEPMTLAVFGLMAAGGAGYVRRRNRAAA